VDLGIDDASVTLRLTHAEALRLGVAIAAGYETVSRAEYYIRTGLSEPELRQIAQVLTGQLEPSTQHISLPLEAGVEEIENPRRPRPPR
jgi:hypothetical protein